MKDLSKILWAKRRVPVAVIDFANSPMTRDAISKGVVAEYASRMEAGDRFPLPKLVETGGGFLIADGLHRIHACMSRGQGEVDVVCVAGDYEFCLLVALSSNQTHGLQRSNADKRRCVLLALKTWPKEPHAEIARRCGVSHTLVNSIVDSKQPKANAAANGRQATTNGQASTESGSAQEPTTEPTAAPVAPSVVLDKTRLPVPEGIMPLWKRAEEVQELLSALSKVRGAVRKAEEEADPLFAEVKLSTLTAELGNAYSNLLLAMPHAVCPNCQGKAQTMKNCRLCNARGIVSKFRWDTQVSKELKTLRALSVEQLRKEKKGQ